MLTRHLHINTTPIDSDWGDALAEQLTKQHLQQHASKDHSQGRWAALHLSKDQPWQVGGKPLPLDLIFVIKARAHTLLTGKYVCHHISGCNACPFCSNSRVFADDFDASVEPDILLVEDVGEHWYHCHAMEEAWQLAEARVQHQLSIEFYLSPAHHELLTWGLVPPQLPSRIQQPVSLNSTMWQAFTCAWLSAAHEVWCTCTSL